MLNNGRMDLVMGGSAVSMIGAEKLSEKKEEVLLRHLMKLLKRLLNHSVKI